MTHGIINVALHFSFLKENKEKGLNYYCTTATQYYYCYCCTTISITTMLSQIFNLPLHSSSRHTNYNYMRLTF